MIDTHCHLTDPRLQSQLEAVIQRASSAGVSRLLTIGTDIGDDARCIEVCRDRPNVRCVVGVHPNYVAEESFEKLQTLRDLQMDDTVVALGEMGLDYHYDRSPRDRQRQFFEWQLELARTAGKPVVIHCREAVDDCLAIMANFPQVKGVYHCFTGTPEEAQRILNAGYLLGFTGPVTFKKNDALRDAVRLTPLDRLLVETDAPYLSPEPMRGQKVNEPALVMHTAAVVARVKNISLEELDAATTRNAIALFSLPKNWLNSPT